MVETIDYENVYLQNGFKKAAQRGKVKFATSGIAFKDSDKGNVFTIRAEDIRRMNWRRCSREYQVRVYSAAKDANGLPMSLNGLPRDAFEELKDFVKVGDDEWLTRSE